MALNLADNNTLTNFFWDRLHKHHNSLFSVIALAAFGGTAFYLVRGRRSRSESSEQLIKNGVDERVVNSKIEEALLSDLPPEVCLYIEDKCICMHLRNMGIICNKIVDHTL